MPLRSYKFEQIIAGPNFLTIFSAIMPFCGVNIRRLSISHKNVYIKTRMFLFNKKNNKKYFNTIFIYNISKYIGFSPVFVTIVKTNCKV